MLHTKFRENRPAGSGEEDFLSFFYHIWAWRPPSWSCDLDFAIKLLLPLPKLCRGYCQEHVYKVQDSST